MTFTRAYEGACDGLFKFRPYDTEDDRHRVKQLLAGRAFFPILASFNDPFEGRMSFNLGDPATFHQRLQKSLERIAINRNFEPPGQLDNVDPIRFVQNMTESHQRGMRAEHRFFCLCGTREHPLLWSHYGDCHRGICLHFGHKTHPFGHALKVEYEDSYPEVEVLPDMGRDEAELLRRSVLTKAAYWAYEHEYRVVSIRDDNPTWHLDCPWSEDRSILYFNPKCIVAVTIGAEMHPDAEADFRCLLSAMRPDIKVERAVLKKNQYALEFMPG